LLSFIVRRLRWLAIKSAKNCGFAAVGEHAGSWQSLRPPELRLRGRRRHCGSCGFSAVGGVVGVSRRTSCCSGPPLLLDSVARVIIGAAAEQSRSPAQRGPNGRPFLAALGPSTRGCGETRPLVGVRILG